MPDPTVCVTCGAHVPGDAPPSDLCPICDERAARARRDGRARAGRRVRAWRSVERYVRAVARLLDGARLPGPDLA